MYGMYGMYVMYVCMYVCNVCMYVCMYIYLPYIYNIYNKPGLIIGVMFINLSGLAANCPSFMAQTIAG